MSWILHELWDDLEKRQEEYSTLLQGSSPRVFAVINGIASGVGSKWGVTIQVNLPSGGDRARGLLAHRNVSLLFDPGRKRFHGVKEVDVRGQLGLLGCSVFEPT
ncbi:MAG TPA: hypothetical protein VE177_02335, partial [Candidatus Binatus sp.]|nr:hypothetical protein [Candidatus Binatus sp.]